MAMLTGLLLTPWHAFLFGNFSDKQEKAKAVQDELQSTTWRCFDTFWLNILDNRAYWNMNDDLKRNNHYVPIWYQKNFLSSKKGSFHYLNLYPDKIELPNGKIKPKKQICWPFSPKQCFYQTDLSAIPAHNVPKIIFSIYVKTTDFFAICCRK